MRCWQPPHLQITRLLASKLAQTQKAQKNKTLHSQKNGRINNTDFKVWNALFCEHFHFPLPADLSLPLFFFPLSSAHTSCLFLYFFISSLLCPSHHTCFLPFAPSLYPSSCPSLPPTSYSPVTPFILVLSLLPSWMFLSNIYQQALTVSNLLETLSKITAFLCLHTTKKDSRELGRVLHALWR